MTKLGDFIKETGDEAKDLIKIEVKKLVKDAKLDANNVVKETGELVEKWLIKRAKGQLNDKELKRLIEARNLEVMQQLNTENIAARSKVEGMADKLVGLIADGVIETLF